MPDHSQDVYESRGLTFDPPQYMRDIASQASAWIDAGLAGDGMEPETKAWVTRIAEGGAFNPDKVFRARNFLIRNGGQIREFQIELDRTNPAPAWVARFAWFDDSCVMSASQFDSGERTRSEAWFIRLCDSIEAIDAEIEQQNQTNRADTIGSKGITMSIVSGKCLSVLKSHVDRFNPQSNQDTLRTPSTLTQAGDSYCTSNGCLKMDLSGPIASIEVRGPIYESEPYWEGVSWGQMVECLKAAQADQRVEVVLVNLLSPGGEVNGMFTACDTFAGRNAKPVVVYAEQMCSAAYIFGSVVADHIMVPMGSESGHIGVFKPLWNWSEQLKQDGISVTYVQAGAMKTAGFPDVPLEPSAIEMEQRIVNEVYDTACQYVARARRITVNQVKATEARVFNATDAIQNGLVDSIGTFNQAMQYAYQLTKSGRKNRKISTDTNVLSDEVSAMKPSIPLELSAHLGLASDAGIDDAIGAINALRSASADMSESVRLIKESLAAQAGMIKPLADRLAQIEIEIEPKEHETEPYQNIKPMYAVGARCRVMNGAGSGSEGEVVAANVMPVYDVKLDSGEMLSFVAEANLVAADSPESAVATELAAQRAEVDRLHREREDLIKTARLAQVTAGVLTEVDVATRSNKARMDLLVQLVSARVEGGSSVAEAVQTVKADDPALWSSTVAQPSQSETKANQAVQVKPGVKTLPKAAQVGAGVPVGAPVAGTGGVIHHGMAGNVPSMFKY